MSKHRIHVSLPPLHYAALSAYATKFDRTISDALVNMIEASDLMKAYLKSTTVVETPTKPVAPRRPKRLANLPSTTVDKLWLFHDPAGVADPDAQGYSWEDMVRIETLHHANGHSTDAAYRRSMRNMKERRDALYADHPQVEKPFIAALDTLV